MRISFILKFIQLNSYSKTIMQLPHILHFKGIIMTFFDLYLFYIVFQLWESVLQPGKVILVIQVIQVNRVTLCQGQPGLTHFIKYPGLIQILDRIIWVNNDVWRLRFLGQCEHIMSRYFEKSHLLMAWEHQEKYNKIALRVQVACTATALCSQTIWHARRLLIFHHNWCL